MPRPASPAPHRILPATVRSLWQDRFRRPNRARLSLERLEPKIALAADSFAGDASDFTPFGDRLFFVASDPEHGRELWVTDGTATGTQLLKDIRSGARGSDPHALTVIGNTLFFVADDGSTGTELWKSDGTADGTVLVKDIFTGTYLGYDYTSPTFDPYGYNEEVELPNSSSPRAFASFHGELFFAATIGESGDESLWHSDGTPEGTAPVVGPFTGGAPLGILDDRLLISADGGLWSIDGTESGTAFIAPVQAEMYDLGLDFNGRVLFQGRAVPDGDGYRDGGLWITDGTGEGTAELRTSFYSYGLTLADTPAGQIVFFLGWDSETGGELWRTDGTAEGTVLVKDINTGTEVGYDGEYPRSSYPHNLTAFGAGILFSADGGQGHELWWSDGSAEGTVLVKDLALGTHREIDYDGHSQIVPNSGAPEAFTFFGEDLYFIANRNQLWTTDGTPAGTRLVKDIDGAAKPKQDGGSGGGPTDMTVFGDRLIFSGDHAKSGAGLWTSDGTAAGTIRLRNLPSRIESVDPPAARTYAAGETLTVTATFNEAVTVTGLPSIPLTIGTRTVRAFYEAGSGTAALSFTATVPKGAFDADGITIGTISSKGATITNAFRTRAFVDYAPSIAAAVLVDAIGPKVVSFRAPNPGTYVPGVTLTFDIVFDKAITATGTPALTVTIGRTQRRALLESQPDATTLRFAYEISPLDSNDLNGIAVAGLIDLNGGTLTDELGNAAALKLKVPSLKNVKVSNPVPP